MMTLRLLRIPVVSAPVLLLAGGMLFAVPAIAQSRPAEPASPYGGQTVEEIIARVNDQIITSSDYDRAMKELDDEGRQRGLTMQEISDEHKDLLRNLIDQQLWLSKGKELGITGETELINQLDQIRKQYHLASMEDLEKAAQEQGVSFEDFKANIRNQIITREVMRQEVGAHINITPGEVQRYYEAHQQDYTQPESVQLSEILVSTGDNPDDAQKVAAAKDKADGVEAKLQGGADFAELARTSSDGPTAGEGGDLGEFKRGALAKVLEDATFGLKAGQFTEPIRTRQGFVIFKVTQHNAGGVAPFSQVQNQAEDAYYMTRMEPAIRAYLTKMREDSYVTIRPGYVDTGASTNKRIIPITYSAYTPPSQKKKRKVERTRFRENAHYRQKSPRLVQASATTTTTAQDKKAEKPGKKEKIRYGRAPEETLPSTATPTRTEDAGATGAAAGTSTQVAQSSSDTMDSPFDQAASKKKTRFSDRARQPKEKKQKTGPDVDTNAPAPPDAAEVADRQTQSQPLGLAGDTTNKKKKNENATSGVKTRYSDREKTEKKEKQEEKASPPQPTPIPPVSGAPAPAATPQQ
jgi:peptidyl-prolyl cis-trans isomerase SurA